MWLQHQFVKIGRDMRDENQLSGGFFSRRQNRSPAGAGKSGSGTRHKASQESSVIENSPHQMSLQIPAMGAGSYHHAKSKSISGFVARSRKGVTGGVSAAGSPFMEQTFSNGLP